jgi:predicted small metal-binding protein
MKIVACKELELECDISITGQNDEEVIEGVFSHLREVHPKHEKKMTEAARNECIESIKHLLDSAPE